MSIRKLAGDTLIYGISSIVGRLLYFLLTPLYTHLFPTEEYGIVTDLFAYIGFALVLFTYRFDLAYFRFAGKGDHHPERVFNTGMTSVLISTLFLGVIFLLLSPFIATVSAYPDRSGLVQIATLILIFDAINELPFARLRLEGKAFRFALLRMINIGINLGANLFFLVLCPWILSSGSFSAFHPFIHAVYDPDFGIGYIFLSNVLASFITALFLLPQYRDIRLKIDPVIWKKMMNYALPLILVGFSYVINEMFDRKMMVHLLPGTASENLSQLGIYGANYKLAMILALFTQAFRYGAEPFFFRQFKEEGSLKAYARVAQYFSIAGFLGILVVLFYLDLFKYFIPDPNYWTGLGVVPVLLFANLFLGMYYNFSIWYKLTDQTMYGAWISMGGAAVTILLNFLLVPAMGIMGAAWATLSCYGLMMIATAIIGRKHLSVPYPFIKMVFYLILVGGVLALSWWWRPLFDSLPLLLVANSGLLIICAGVFWMSVRGKEE